MTLDTPMHIGMSQTVPVQPVVQAQLLGLMQRPFTQPWEHIGVVQSLPVQSVVQVQLPGLLHIPPF